jgi:hypothetical protein
VAASYLYYITKKRHSTYKRRYKIEKLNNFFCQELNNFF